MRSEDSIDSSSNENNENRCSKLQQTVSITFLDGGLTGGPFVEEKPGLGPWNSQTPAIPSFSTDMKRS
jgi:hypothetical protein